MMNITNKVLLLEWLLFIHFWVSSISSADKECLESKTTIALHHYTPLDGRHVLLVKRL